MVEQSKSMMELEGNLIKMYLGEHIHICSRMTSGVVEHVIIKNDALDATNQYCINILHENRLRLPFHRELYALQKIHHNNLVRIHNIGKINRNSMAVCDYYSKKAKPKSRGQALAWLKELAVLCDNLRMNGTPLRRITCDDIMVGNNDEPIIRTLGWLNMYCEPTDYRAQYETAWSIDIQHDLLSFLLIAKEWLFGSSRIEIPDSVEDFIGWFLHACTAHNPHSTCKSAKDIFDFLQEVCGESKDDIRPFAGKVWSIEMFFLHHHPFTFVHIPKGRCHYRGVELLMERSLWISQKTVSVEMMSFILKKTVSELEKEGVSWMEAIRFCNHLSKICGYEAVYALTPTGQVKRNRDRKGFRLPFEAELMWGRYKATSFIFHSQEEWCFDSYEPDFWLQDIAYQPLERDETRGPCRVLVNKESRRGQHPEISLRDISFRLVWNGQ